MKTQTRWQVTANALVTLILAIGWSAAALAAGDWPMYRGPNHNGRVAEPAAWPEGGAKELWKQEIGAGFAAVTVSQGKAYAMGNRDNQDTVYCFESATGQELWRQSYPCEIQNKNHEGGPCATPAVDGDRVYTLSKSGDLICWEGTTGEVKWQKNVMKELGLSAPTWAFAGSPLVMADKVIINAGTAGTACDKMTGAVVWQNGKTTPGYATPVPFTAEGQTTVLIFGAKNLYLLDVADGKEIARFPWETSYDANIADPIVLGHEVFISTGYGRGCALLRFENGAFHKLWENKNLRNHFNNSVERQGFVYGFDEAAGGSLRCVDVKTGEVRWEQKGLGKGTLILAESKLVILSEKGKLVLAEADPAGYRELGQSQILSGRCWTMPALADGRLYARNAQGNLVCVALK